MIPQLLYPRLTDNELRVVSSAETRIHLQQAQSQLQNGARSSLLQAIAGLLVVAGAIATWRQVQVNREGQITERFTRAVDQIGSEHIDVRIGGIYAPERVARNSAPDRPQVQYLLGAFVRGHSPWQGALKGGINVLGRRPPAPDALRLYLSRVDLQSANLNGACLMDAVIRHSNLARAWLADARLDRAELQRTDLRQARPIRATFANANLREARLEGANMRGADLRGADLRGADMRARHLDKAIPTGATADVNTVWPPNFELDEVE